MGCLYNHLGSVISLASSSTDWYGRGFWVDARVKRLDTSAASQFVATNPGTCWQGTTSVHGITFQNQLQMGLQMDVGREESACN
jgi:hypothetical protein